MNDKKKLHNIVNYYNTHKQIPGVYQTYGESPALLALSRSIDKMDPSLENLI